MGGTGALGAALAGRLAKAGYQICIGSRDPYKAQALAEEMAAGASGAGLANSAAAEALTSVLIQLNRRYKLVQAGIRITGSAKGAL